ncbi:MAG: hypothetical protein KF859_03335 [Phycisphaeraceae bacterium]|nr:hypothetical protein [Phycisphaeraceae bacterium]
MTGPNQENAARSQSPSTGTESLRADELSSRIDALLSEIGEASHRIEEQVDSLPLAEPEGVLPESVPGRPTLLPEVSEAGEDEVGRNTADLAQMPPSMDCTTLDEPAHAPVQDVAELSHTVEAIPNEGTGLGEMSERELELELAAQAQSGIAADSAESNAAGFESREKSTADNAAHELPTDLPLGAANEPSAPVGEAAGEPLGEPTGEPEVSPSATDDDALSMPQTPAPAPMSLDQLDRQLAEITEALPPDPQPRANSQQPESGAAAIVPQSSQPIAAHAAPRTPAHAAAPAEPAEQQAAEPRVKTSTVHAVALTATCAPVVAMLGGPIAKLPRAARSMVSLMAVYTLLLGAGAWVYLGYFRPSELAGGASFDFERGQLADVESARGPRAEPAVTKGKESDKPKGGH